MLNEASSHTDLMRFGTLRREEAEALQLDKTDHFRLLIYNENVFQANIREQLSLKYDKAQVDQ